MGFKSRRVIAAVGSHSNHTPRELSPDEPAPTIKTQASDRKTGGWVRERVNKRPRSVNAKVASVNGRPPYRVPSMAEIEAIPWNGYTVASTFSGGGGSCLGYRMAGFRVAWANEFLAEARDSYEANHPRSVLDGRDIREVTGAEVLGACGLERGELDLLDGSPPCTPFSTAGARAKGWGKERQTSDGVQRDDDLFLEYARLVEEIQPRVFVAENVSGLVKGVAKGYFKIILKRLEDAGYRVAVKLLDAKWLGVPQSRTRVIFVGVREDLGVEPAHPKPLPYYYSIRDAIGDMAQGRLERGIEVERVKVRPEQRGEVHADLPSPAICAQGISGGNHGATKIRRVVHDTSGLFSQGDVLDKPSPAITISGGAAEHHFQVYEDETLEGTMLAEEAKKLGPGETSDKYFNLSRPHPDAPSPTVSAVGGSHRGTAAVVHPDGWRKFTIAELRRICGFPDDYELVGTYGQQWHRLGNAVPPVMMSHVARVVRDEILRKLDER
jgi:DNA (cytosine-5)-methyltransferase 1